MKFLLFFLLSLCMSIDAVSQKFNPDGLIDFRTGMNAVFRQEGKSPLAESDRAIFTGLDFYPANEKFFIIAEFKRTPEEQPFEMLTTTTRKPLYRKFGELLFEIDGKRLKLNVYQNIELSKREDSKDNLFLPFTDLTSGNETYGGGRYIELKVPSGDTLEIDFNKAYNPYCAYNPKYSCPIVPAENDLPVAIRAGVKKFH